MNWHAGHINETKLQRTQNVHDTHVITSPAKDTRLAEELDMTVFVMSRNYFFMLFDIENIP